MPRLIFISHSSVDTWVARKIAEEIHRCGAETFLDEANIQIGADFEEVILKALERADELLVLLTPWSIERPYVMVELGAALVLRIPIIGVLHGLTAKKLQKKATMPVFLKKRNLIDLNGIDKYFEELRERVEAEKDKEGDGDEQEI